MKNLIKNYNSLTWVKINKSFVQKSQICSVNPEERRIHTAAVTYTLSEKDFKQVIEDLGFN